MRTSCTQLLLTPFLPFSSFPARPVSCGVHWSKASLYFREGADHGSEYPSSAVTSHGQLSCNPRNVKGRKWTEVFDSLEKLESKKPQPNSTRPTTQTKHSPKQHPPKQHPPKPTNHLFSQHTRGSTYRTQHTLKRGGGTWRCCLYWPEAQRCSQRCLWGWQDTVQQWHHRWCFPWFLLLLLLPRPTELVLGCGEGERKHNRITDINHFNLTSWTWTGLGLKETSIIQQHSGAGGTNSTGQLPQHMQCSWGCRFSTVITSNRLKPLGGFLSALQQVTHSHTSTCSLLIRVPLHSPTHL